MSENPDTPAQRAASLVERARFLDPLADTLTRLLGPLRRMGPVSTLLSGSPIGHPAHPAAVMVPLGAWSSALVLDAVGGESTQEAATALVGIGVLGSAPAALSGAHDWLGTEGTARRVGVVHALVNGATLGCFAASWVARRSGNRRRGITLSVAGATCAGLSAWLGGHLTYVQGVGVRERPVDPAHGTLVTGAEPGLVALLTRQHADLAELLATLQDSTGEQRSELFLELRGRLAVHEAAEQVLVHALTDRELPGGHAIASARRDEEARAGNIVSELEQFAVDDAAFSERLRRLASALATHAEHEEVEELPRLQRQLGPDTLQQVAAELRQAQEAAAARIVALRPRSFVAMLEVAREAITQRD